MQPSQPAEPPPPSDDARDITLDVRAALDQKIAALVAHRSQYALDADLLPRQVLLLPARQNPLKQDEEVSPAEVRCQMVELAVADNPRLVLSRADQLDITVNTVRNYIRSIYDKLQVHTKSEAVSKALRRRLID